MIFLHRSVYGRPGRWSRIALAGACCFFHFKRHTLTVLPGINRRHACYRDDHWKNTPAESALKGDLIITKMQLIGRFQPDVEHNLAVLDKFLWHASGGINRDRKIWRKALIHAPFVQCTDQIGLG